MGSPRDMQSHVAAFAPEVLALATTGGDITSAAIDTQGFNRVMFTLALASAIGAGDVNYVVTESDDDVTYTDVPADAYLPSTAGPGNKVIDPIAPYLQTIGAVSEKRYQKVRFESTTLALSIDMTLSALAAPQLMSFVGFSGATTDGKP